MITRNYFMSVMHHRLDGSQYFDTATMTITSFFRKEIHLVMNYLVEALEKAGDEDLQAKDTTGVMQIISFNRI